MSERVARPNRDPRDGALGKYAESGARLRLLEANGAQLIADVSGALFWASEAILIVADLHLEKGSSFAERGSPIPPYDTRATLSALEKTCSHFRPATVIALGDSFHDNNAEHRISGDDRERISRLTSAYEWIWIAGNHDPEPTSYGGHVLESIAIGPLLFRHEPTPAPVAGEVAGHLHPCASVRIRGKRLRRRCFATDGSRVVVPAFGAYTGGLDVLDPAFAMVFPGLFHAFMIGRRAVHPVAHHRLVPD